MSQENIQIIINQIKNEFERLKEATDYIDTSKEAVKTLIKDFAEIMLKINESYTFQTTEYKTEFIQFKEELNRYKEELKFFTDKIFKDFEEPVEQFNNLSTSTKQIIKKIDAINFPERLDKLEHNVESSILEISLANKELNRQSKELINEIENIKFSEKFEKLKIEIQLVLKGIEKLNQEFETRIKEQLQIQYRKSSELIQSVSELNIPDKINELEKAIQNTNDQIVSINNISIAKTEKLVKEINEIHISSRLDKLDATVAGITQSIQSVLQRFETFERNLKESQQNKTNDILRSIEKTEVKFQKEIKNITGFLDAFQNNNNEITKRNNAQILSKINELKSQNKFNKLLIILIAIILSINIVVSLINF